MIRRALLLVLLAASSAAAQTYTVRVPRLAVTDAPARTSGESVGFIDANGNFVKGTLGKGDLPAAIAYEDEANAFTQTQTFKALVTTDTFASHTTGWAISYAGAADFRSIYTGELHATKFVTDLETALRGSQVITKSVALVAKPVAGTQHPGEYQCPPSGVANYLWIADDPAMAPGVPLFENDDWVVLRVFTRTDADSLTIADCVGQVTQDFVLPEGGVWDNPAPEQQQLWMFQRGGYSPTADTIGSADDYATITPDSLALDYGDSGNGYWETSAFDGTNGVNAPYAQAVIWTTAPTATYKVPYLRIGKLTGLTSTSNEFGLIAGRYVNPASCAPNCAAMKYLRASNDQVSLYGVGLSIYDSDSANLVLDPTGPSFALGNAAPTAYGTGTGIWMGNDSGTYKMRVGDPSGNRLTWDGTALAIIAAGGDVSVDGSGIALSSASSGTWVDSKAVHWKYGSDPAANVGVFSYYAGTTRRLSVTNTSALTTVETALAARQSFGSGNTGQLTLSSTSTAAKLAIDVDAAGSVTFRAGAGVNPSVTNQTALGTADLRWSTIFADLSEDHTAVYPLVTDGTGEFKYFDDGSGTRTIVASGTCTITVVNGLVTGVTGCS